MMNFLFNDIPDISSSSGKNKSRWAGILDIYPVGKMMLSPLRHERHPSFKIDIKNGERVWYDFGLGIGGSEKEFYFIINNVKKEIKMPKNTKNVDKSDFKFEIEFKPFSESDLLWWAKQGIRKNTLEIFDVGCVNVVYKKINKAKHTYLISKLSEPIYVYVYYTPFNNVDNILKGENNIHENNSEYYKLYCPLSSHKWKSELRGLWVDGYQQVIRVLSSYKKDDILIITKGRKDVMSLYEMGYNAISFNTETININHKFIDHLKEKFKNIIIFYDNDSTGIKFAQKLGSEFNLPSIIIPQVGTGSKDISECIKNNGIKYSTNLFQELIRSKLPLT